MEPCRLAFLSQTQDLFLELKRFVMYSPSTEDWHPLTLWVSPQSHFWLQPVLWIQHQLSAVAVNCFALMPNHMLNNSNLLSPCLRENYLIEKMSEAQFLTQHYGSCIKRIPVFFFFFCSPLCYKTLEAVFSFHQYLTIPFLVRRTCLNPLECSFFFPLCCQELKSPSV